MISYTSNALTRRHGKDSILWGKVSKNKLACKNAMTYLLYGSCSLRVMDSCICLNEGVDIQMDVHMDDFVRTKISCVHRFLLPMVFHCARFAYARAPLILIPKNTKTCLAKQDQAVWIYVIKNLNRECNFEIVNKLNINSVISFVHRVFEMYVTVNNPPIQDYVHQDESYSNLLMK